MLFDLDGQEHETDAKGMYLNGVPGADIIFDEEDFHFDIAAQYTCQALEAAIECQNEMG